MKFLANTDKGGYAGPGIWDYDFAVASSDFYKMIYSNGSWRPVCYTIKSFNP